MLFFRAEERVKEWCAARDAPVRPLVSMSQLWTMATTWYGARLEPVSRRPKAEEMRGIFATIGLADEFWDPGSDRFG